MQFKGTNQVRETTIYRVLGDGTKHVFEYVFRDAFTCTLLALVIFTNLIVFLVPVALSMFEFSIAKVICQSASIGLLMGYATLITLLVAKLPKTQKVTQSLKGHLSFTHAPRLRKSIIGMQCLLFASLISGTIIMKQQLGLIKLVDPANYTQQVMSKTGSSPMKPMDILPLLNNE